MDAGTTFGEGPRSKQPDRKRKQMNAILIRGGGKNRHPKNKDPRYKMQRTSWTQVILFPMDQISQV